MIPIYQPQFSGREKEYVNRCLDSTWISSKGEFIPKFEEQFAAAIGARHATSVCNGTVALHLALTALGLGPGDEVIVPTFTYIASVNSITQVGAKPVFVDSLEATWQLDPEDVRKKITPRTKAVLAVHLYGQPCDMDALARICGEGKLLLIEDCAEAFGTYYKGRHVGTFGDIATFSFFGNKTITTGEGGMVVSKTPETHQRAYHFKTQGVSPTRDYWHDVVGYNYRMTNICAALGLAQLEQADDILRRKNQVAQWYAEGLKGLPLKMPKEDGNIQSSHWLVSVVLDRPGLIASLRSHLKNDGIDSRPFFHPAHTLPPYAGTGSFPVAESLADRGISLPSYPALSEAQVQKICGSIRSFLK